MNLNSNQTLRQMHIKPIKSAIAVNYALPHLLPNSDQLTKSGFLKRKIQTIYKSRSKAIKFTATITRIFHPRGGRMDSSGAASNLGNNHQGKSNQSLTNYQFSVKTLFNEGSALRFGQ